MLTIPPYGTLQFRLLWLHQKCCAARRQYIQELLKREYSDDEDFLGPAARSARARLIAYLEERLRVMLEIGFAESDQHLNPDFRRYWRQYLRFHALHERHH